MTLNSPAVLRTPAIQCTTGMRKIIPYLSFVRSILVIFLGHESCNSWRPHAIVVPKGFFPSVASGPHRMAPACYHILKFPRRKSRPERIKWRPFKKCVTSERGTRMASIWIVLAQLSSKAIENIRCWLRLIDSFPRLFKEGHSRYSRYTDRLTRRVSKLLVEAVYWGTHGRDEETIVSKIPAYFNLHGFDGVSYSSCVISTAIWYCVRNFITATLFETLRILSDVKRTTSNIGKHIILGAIA